MFFKRKPAAMPDELRALLNARLPHCAALTPELRARFEPRTMEFLGKKKFYGCNGLAVTEEMRVLVAGQAALLLLREDARVYPKLRSVLLYPTAFWVRHEEPDEDGIVYEDEVLQVGESQEWGRVILSWEDVEAALEGDPVNVPVHEFAHQLDEENPDTEGAPLLPEYARWSKVMGAAYEELQRRPSKVLDDYGCEGPAEFFAVASEAYFQSGPRLKKHHPELYSLLKDYYLLDTLGDPR